MILARIGGDFKMSLLVVEISILSAAQYLFDLFLVWYVVNLIGMEGRSFNGLMF